MVEVPFRKVGEDCGVVAVYRPGGAAAELVHRALFALQHRGQEASGIAVWNGSEISHLKGRGLVAESLPTYRVANLDGDSAIGHNRYSTVTVDRSENIQPFLAGTPYGRFAIAHNGNIKNQDALTQELEAEGALLSTTMDTELIVHLIARSGAATFEDALRKAFDRAKGAYSLTMVVNGKLYGARDPNGIRPLVLGKLHDGG
ncbi:MAG: amidophosphoribosyltransferase, partial [Myxococcota bacterium]